MSVNWEMTYPFESSGEQFFSSIVVTAPVLQTVGSIRLDEIAAPFLTLLSLFLYLFQNVMLVSFHQLMKRSNKMYQYTKAQWLEEMSEAKANGCRVMDFDQWVAYRKRIDALFAELKGGQ